MSGQLVEITDLTKTYQVRSRWGRRETVRALDGVSLSINEGETYGLVGESGSGKSTLARCLLRLIEPTSGQLRVNGIDVRAARGAQLRALRQGVSIVFQNPVAALNPRFKVGEILAEPLRTHQRLGRAQVRDRTLELLEQVGLGRDHLGRRPHELSGGQCQRVGIARAIATNPRLLVLDEPTSALDVSVQAQVLNLLADLQERHGLTYLLISHDLDVVRYLSDRVGVMYLGRLVEQGESSAVLDAPAHPYTRGLVAAAVGGRSIDEHEPLSGEIPGGQSVPAGCRFHPRCPLHARLVDSQICRSHAPPTKTLPAGREVECHFASAIQEKPATNHEAIT